ncbi:MAG: hypothetical protein R3264_17690 [Anaerolineae bacterium]|nr:hypothetical protein [Anaerolineae bacterium]
MIPKPMDDQTHLAPSSEAAINSEPAIAPPDAAEAEVELCSQCEAVAAQSCRQCNIHLCDACSYHEAGGTKYYCRACADALVGVCDVCEALHARPCRTCGLKVCEAHQKRVTVRWGWGGVSGQGGVVDWFPILHTYCQEHGQNRLDIPRPLLKTFNGYDGSSPEW